MEEMKSVLANWIRQALEGPGKLPDSKDKAEWVAERFVAWLHPQVVDRLSSLRSFSHQLRGNAEGLGGWKNDQIFGIMDTLTHLEAAIGDLETVLGTHPS